MPPRVARSAVSAAKPNTARKKSQKRMRDAFSIASHSAPEKLRIRQHRLGESEGSEPRQKRRRLEDDEDDDEDDEYDGRTQKKAVTKMTDGPRAGGVDDMGSDSEGNEWRMGGDIGDDSDSDIDSDEAFGSSDEERFEGFTFRGSATSKGPAKKKQIKRPVAKDMDLDEDDQDEEEEDEDDFGDEGVDLATMLDDSEDDEDEGHKKSKKDRSTEQSSDEDEYSGDEDGDEDADSDTSMSGPDSEPDDADPEKLSKLQDLVASLETEVPDKRLAARSVDANESQQPSDFGLTSSQKLKISDLLPTVTDPTLRRSLKVLASDKPSKKTGVPGKLEAPLPKRQQDRIDRAAATQKAKETLDRWRDTVIQNRRAEHLQFPLIDPQASEAPGTTRMVATQQNKPQTELENAILNILEESGVSTKKNHDEEDMIAQGEELELKKIPIEEVMARRAELRRARDLLFREEVKAKRIKKIKSRSYRRVHRHERERQAEADHDMLDPEGEGLDEDEKEKQDRRRAEERMGAKHKESKWAKGAKKAGRTVWDDDTREGMIDMARRNEELRRRIEGKDVRNADESDSDFSDDEQDDDSDIDDDSEAEARKLTKKLDKLAAMDKEKDSGLGGMAFMKRADAARKAQNDEAVEQMRRELAGEVSDVDQDADTTIGRRVFGPAPTTTQKPTAKPKRGELEEGSESEADEIDIIVDQPTAKSAQQPRKPKSILSRESMPKPAAAEFTVTDDDDPWITAVSGEKKPKKSSEGNEYIPSSKVNTTTSTQTVKKPAKAQSKSSSKSTATVTPAVNTDGWKQVPYKSAHDSDNGNDSDDARTDPILTDSAQQSYHDRAFAGDDVALAFATDKEVDTTAQDEQEVSSALPGWGSWAGTGLTKAARRAAKKSLHNPLFKTKVEGVRAADRRDANLKNVVISEAQQRKGKKFLATSLPAGFERRDQYERSLRVPIGPEWTTKETFQRQTKPRVVVKQGIVEAMEKPMV